MPDTFSTFGATLAAFLPNLLIALIVLVVGWLVAFAISKLVENLLHRTTLDDRLAGGLRGGHPERIPAERIIALVVFWLIMLFVIMIFLQTLNLGMISAPINTLLTQVLAYLPNLLAAAGLVLLAWVIATVLRLLITRVLSASGISQRLSDNANVDPRNRITIGQTIGNVVYWLVFLLFLPAILGALQLQGILAPVQGMVNSILGALPNILGAVLVLAVGWLVARIVRSIVANLLTSIGIDRLGDQTGVQGALRTQRLSDVIATIVFVLILIPVAIAALNILDIPAISQPAANMLNQILNAIPAIFGAFLVLAIAFFVARLVGRLVASLLASIGFNRLFSETGPIPVTGLTGTTGSDIPVTGTAESSMGAETDPERTLRQNAMDTVRRSSPADVVGWIVMTGILLFAAMEASQMLGFETLTVLIGQFIVAAWNILFGLIIFGLGLWISNVVYRMVRETGTTNAHILATAARVAILIFAGALALRQMGIADSIVNLAFGLMLGAVAVAAAIAFGWGGRNMAADLLERWRGQVREQASRTPPPMTPRQGNIPVTGTTSTGIDTGTTDFDRTSGLGSTGASDFDRTGDTGLGTTDFDRTSGTDEFGHTDIDRDRGFRDPDDQNFGTGIDDDDGPDIILPRP